MYRNCDPNWNITDDSNWHREKQFSSIDSTEEGIRIEVSAMQSLNAALRMCRNCDPDSNITDDSERHREKQYSSIDSTEEGT
jgi:hypothetical protein